MNKKEIAEIKKQFCAECCTIDRICSCYVDGEKNIRTTMREAFLSMPEEEIFKYFNIFRKALSGHLGKNMLNLEFPMEEEAAGGKMDFLLRLRDSKLSNEYMLDEFYRKVIENYFCPGNYYIILTHGTYDIPGKASDGSEMFDASEEVYEYLLGCICPVKLSKAGLAYQPQENRVENRIQDWVVEEPLHGFLFPAFNDRQTDIHGMLYSARKAEELQPDFMESMFGCPVQLSAGSQKDAFHTLIADVLGEGAGYEEVADIYEHLEELAVEVQDSPDPVQLSREDVRRLFEECGVSEEKMETFDRMYAAAVGNGSLTLQNIACGRRFRIETPDVKIEVAPDRLDLVEARFIDGKECLVVTVNDRVEVDGMNVRTIGMGGLENEENV